MRAVGYPRAEPTNPITATFPRRCGHRYDAPLPLSVVASGPGRQQPIRAALKMRRAGIRRQWGYPPESATDWSSKSTSGPLLFLYRLSRVLGEIDMIRSDLVWRIWDQNPHLLRPDVETIVHAIFDENTRHTGAR
jgi:hypothetical protein